MIDTEYRCQEVLRWFRSDVMETLEALEFYHKTLEKLIADTEDQEGHRFETTCAQLPTDKQGEFWSCFFKNPESPLDFSSYRRPISYDERMAQNFSSDRRSVHDRWTMEKVVPTRKRAAVATATLPTKKPLW